MIKTCRRKQKHNKINTVNIVLRWWKTKQEHNEKELEDDRGMDTSFS